MRVRNTLAQAVILRETNTRGEQLDSIRLAPGDNDIHEKWKAIAEAHPHVATGDAATGPYEGPSRRSFVEPVRSPPPGDPASAVKHDDDPKGGHQGRPAGPDEETARVTPPGGEPTAEEIEAKRKADEAEAKRKADERGPGTRRRDG